jgi:hypothetical protein
MTAAAVAPVASAGALLRALALLLLAGPLLAGCGPSPESQEPEVRKAVLEIFRLAANKDRDGVARLVLGREAMGYADPAAVKKWDTEAGRKQILDGHYTWMRLTGRQAGIQDEAGLARLDANLKIRVNTKPSGTAKAVFDIPPAEQLGKRRVTLVFQKVDGNWKVSGYSVDFVDK